MQAKTEIKTIKPTIFDILYFVFLLLLPLIYFDKLVDPVLIPRQIFLSIFVSIIGLVISYQVHLKKLPADFSFLKLRINLFFLLFAVLIAVSFFQSKVISESIYLLSKIGIEILFFVSTTYLLIQKKLKLAGLIRSVIAFGLVAVLIAVFQFFKLSFSGNNFFDSMLQINSTFGHKNLFASVMFLTLPFLFNSSGLTKSWRIIASVSGFLMLVLVWLLQTKAVIVAFFIFFSILLFLFLRGRKHLVNKRIVKIVLIVGSLILLIAGIVTIQNKQKFSRLFDTKSSFERISLWKNSMEMTKENFVFGVGAGNWQVQFPKYGLDKFADVEVKNGMTTFQRPHNDFLWVLCESGVVGLLVYVSIFIIVLYYLFKLFKIIKEREYLWLYSTFLAAIIAYLIIAFIDFPLERIEHQILLYLMFSIVTAHFYNNFQVSKALKNTIIKLPVFVILFFIPVLFSFIVSVNRCSGEYHTQRIYFYENKSNWGQMISESDKAMSIFYVMDPMSAPIQWYKGVALFSEGKTIMAQACFEKASLLHPNNIHVLNNMASCYENLGDHKKAEEFYLKALSISSEFEEARLNLSAVYYNSKDFEKAFETIDKCSINSTEEKYKLFLPAILDSWINDLLLKHKDMYSTKVISDIKSSKDKTTELYYLSKKKGINFKQYIFENAKH